MHAPPLVMLHGGFVSGASWEPQIDTLGARWRLVCMDLRGHGESASPLGLYSVEGFARDVLETMDELAIDRAVIVGHSLGGMVAQVIGAKHGDRVAGLVLADTSYGISTTPWERIQASLTRAMFHMMSIKRVGNLSARELGKRRRDVARYIRHEMAHFEQDRDTYMRIWRAVFEFDSRSWIGWIECPTLVLAAALNSNTIRQGKMMAAMIPSAQFATVERAGHMLNWDNPEGFDRAVTRFCEAIEWVREKLTK